jgi:hypothetical protein
MLEKYIELSSEYNLTFGYNLQYVGYDCRIIYQGSIIMTSEISDGTKL